MHSRNGIRSDVSSNEMKKEGKLYGQLVNCYRREKQKFGGTSEENWTQVLSDYEEHGEEHEELFSLNRKQKM